jgi:hypothetical protein
MDEEPCAFGWYDVTMTLITTTRFDDMVTVNTFGSAMPAWQIFQIAVDSFIFLSANGR